MHHSISARHTASGNGLTFAPMAGGNLTDKFLSLVSLLALRISLFRFRVNWSLLVAIHRKDLHSSEQHEKLSLSKLAHDRYSRDGLWNVTIWRPKS